MHTRTLSYREPDAAIEALAERFDRESTQVVEILGAVQTVHGRLTPERIVAVARALRVSAARVNGIATFYAMLSSDAPPARTIRTCDGPACMLRGVGHCLASRGRCRIRAGRSRGPVAWGCAIWRRHTDPRKSGGSVDREPTGGLEGPWCG